MKKRLLAFTLAVALTLQMGVGTIFAEEAVGEGSDGASGATVATAIEIKGENEVEVGKSLTLTAGVDAEGGTLPEDLTWVSSAEAIATVDGGTVTAIAAGTTSITVTSVANTGLTCTAFVVTVKPAPTGVTITPAEDANALIGDANLSLTAAVEPSTGVAADQGVTWSIETGDGEAELVGDTAGNTIVVKGLKMGDVTVTATSTADHTKFDTRIVTVKSANIYDFVVSEQPKDATYDLNATSVAPLTFKLIKDGPPPGAANVLSYQWQSKDVNASSESTVFANIVGATGATHTPPVNVVGTISYQCEITNTLVPITQNVLAKRTHGTLESTDTTDPAVITVVNPKSDTTFNITGEDGKEVVAGKTLVMTATASPVVVGGGIDDITWTVDTLDGGNATMSDAENTSTLTATTAGTVTVTATATFTPTDGTASTVTGSTVVTIIPQVETIKVIGIDGASTIKVGADSTLQMVATVSPTDSRQDVEWTVVQKSAASDPPSPATTIEIVNGLLTLGDAAVGDVLTVTATSTDGSAKKGETDITVVDADVQTVYQPMMARPEGDVGYTGSASDHLVDIPGVFDYPTAYKNAGMSFPARQTVDGEFSIITNEAHLKNYARVATVAPLPPGHAENYTDYQELVALHGGGNIANPVYFGVRLPEPVAVRTPNLGIEKAIRIVNGIAGEPITLGDPDSSLLFQHKLMLYIPISDANYNVKDAMDYDVQIQWLNEADTIVLISESTVTHEPSVAKYTATITGETGSGSDPAESFANGARVLSNVDDVKLTAEIVDSLGNPVGGTLKYEWTGAVVGSESDNNKDMIMKFTNAGIATATVAISDDADVLLATQSFTANVIIPATTVIPFPEGVHDESNLILVGDTFNIGTAVVVIGTPPPPYLKSIPATAPLTALKGDHDDDTLDNVATAINGANSGMKVAAVIDPETKKIEMTVTSTVITNTATIPAVIVLNNKAAEPKQADIIESAPVEVLPPPPTPSGGKFKPSSSGGGGSAGTSAAAVKTVTNATVTNDVSKAIESGKSSVTLKNVTSVSLANIEAAKAAAGLKPITMMVDTMVGGKIAARMYVDVNSALAMVSDINTTVKTDAIGTRKTFEKFFVNDIAIASLGQKAPFGMNVKVAAKLDVSKLDATKLIAYAYNKERNTFSRLPGIPFVDKNGFIHINTTLGGDIVVTDALLTRK